MKLKPWEIAKAVGAGVIREVVPGGGLIVEAINAVLPDKYKLPANATGDQLGRTLDEVPPEVRAELAAREFELDMVALQEKAATLRAMLEADHRTPHTTRPYIAKHSFHVVGLSIVIAVLLWGYGVATGNSAMVTSLQQGWPFILAATGPLVALLHAYFGILKQEQRNRLDAARGAPVESGGLLAALRRAVKG